MIPGETPESMTLENFIAAFEYIRDIQESQHPDGALMKFAREYHKAMGLPPPDETDTAEATMMSFMNQKGTGITTVSGVNTNAY
jgi:hypothetical protein